MFLTTMICPVCNQEKSVGVTLGRYPPRCSDCEAKLEKEKLDKFISDFKNLTTDEKLVYLAEKLYLLENGIARLPIDIMNTPIG